MCLCLCVIQAECQGLSGRTPSHFEATDVSYLVTRKPWHSVTVPHTSCGGPCSITNSGAVKMLTNGSRQDAVRCNPNHLPSKSF